MRQRGLILVALAALAALVAVAGCGGSGGSSKPLTKAEWNRQHGAAVTTVSTELDRARASLNAGNQQSIIGDCTLLRDSITDAMKGLPVPDPVSDAALRKALASANTGAADCIQGGRVASNATLNEKAMAELMDAKGQMDLAKVALAAWR
jgi:hypothetical protein